MIGLDTSTRVIKAMAPVRDQAAAVLRLAIQTGDMPAGTALIEREICESLEISRGSLREAMRMLESEGLVQIRPHRSPIVAVLSRAETRELYEVREALEGEGIRLFTMRADEETLEKFEIAGLALAEAIETGDARGLFHAKQDFYEVLFVGAENAVLHSMAENAYSRLASLRSFTLNVPGRREASSRQVRAALASVRARNPEAAESLWRKHVQGAAEAAEQLPLSGDSSTPSG
jgi:DNA-binding GntR family transcriptional regulator